MLQIEILRNE